MTFYDELNHSGLRGSLEYLYLYSLSVLLQFFSLLLKLCRLGIEMNPTFYDSTHLSLYYYSLLNCFSFFSKIKFNNYSIFFCQKKKLLFTNLRHAQTRQITIRHRSFPCLFLLDTSQALGRAFHRLILLQCSYYYCGTSC